MSIDYVIAPPELMTIFHNGVPAAGAKIYTFEAGGGTSTPKATYADGSGTTVNPNPVICDAQGNAKIYWKRETGQPLYYVVVKTADSTSIDTGVTIWSADNYPAEGTASGSVVTVNKNIENYLINGDLSQFPHWLTLDGVSRNTYDNFPIYWNYRKSNTNGAVTLTREEFALGQTDVPNAPRYYFKYSCTATGGGGETYKYLENPFGDITSFDDDAISFSIYAKGSSALAFTVDFIQYFGEEGSPSTTVVTNLINTTLTTNWSQYTAAGISIPSISGKSIGEINSSCAIRINFPLNTTGDVSLSKANLFNSSTIIDPLYQTTSTIDSRGHYLEGMPTGLVIIGSFDEFEIIQAGFIALVEGTIGNASSGASLFANSNAINLFKNLWGNGLPVTPSKGSDWYSDWVAGKQVALPADTNLMSLVIGTGPIGSGTYTTNVYPDVTHGTDISSYTIDFVRFRAYIKL